MFWHNFCFTLKSLFKNKSLIFWTFAFPLLLGTFFNLAFSDIENSEKLDIINIAIVDDENFKEEKVFKEVFDTLSDEDSEERMFNTKYVSESEAVELLNQGEIDGYLIMLDEPKIVVHESGINQTVFKHVTEKIVQSSAIVEDIVNSDIANATANQVNIDYEAIYAEAIKMSQQETVNTQDVSSNNLSYTMIEYYTLIAMTCLYGGMIGVTALNKNLPNMSKEGKRIAVSPVSKFKLILSTILASYVTQLVGLLLLYLYTIFALGVDYGQHFGLVVLLSLVGSLAGLTLGIAISSALKIDENSKTGIVIAVTMLGCFLSGMMGITMKYIVDKNIPIINQLNPANMITDGLYSLYYYETFDRYIFNIGSLLIFSFIMILIAWFSLRRQKYDSI